MIGPATSSHAALYRALRPGTTQACELVVILYAGAAGSLSPAARRETVVSTRQPTARHQEDQHATATSAASPCDGLRQRQARQLRQTQHGRITLLPELVKTTGARCAHSVDSNPNDIGNWDITPKSVEEQAVLHNDSVFVLDEMGQAAGHSHKNAVDYTIDIAFKLAGSTRPISIGVSSAPSPPASARARSPGA